MAGSKRRKMAPFLMPEDPASGWKVPYAQGIKAIAKLPKAGTVEKAMKGYLEYSGSNTGRAFPNGSHIILTACARLDAQGTCCTSYTARPHPATQLNHLNNSLASTPRLIEDIVIANGQMRLTLSGCDPASAPKSSCNQLREEMLEAQEKALKERCKAKETKLSPEALAWLRKHVAASGAAAAGGRTSLGMPTREPRSMVPLCGPEAQQAALQMDVTKSLASSHKHRSQQVQHKQQQVQGRKQRVAH